MNHQNGYPFTGVLDCNLTFEFLKLSVTRKMRLIYAHAPDWPYFGAKTGSTTHGFNDSAISCDVEAEAIMPNPGSESGPRVLSVLNWISMNNLLQPGVLSEPMWEEIEARIDRDAKLKDVENRLCAHHPVRRRRLHLDLSGV